MQSSVGYNNYKGTVAAHVGEGHRSQIASSYIMYYCARQQFLSAVHIVMHKPLKKIYSNFFMCHP